MTEKEFENIWIEKLRGEDKIFPSDFIEPTDFETIESTGKALTLGGEFFGSYEIIDTDGKIVAQVDNYPKAKYLIYASRSKPDTIPVPKDDETIAASVKKYETYLDLIITEMRKEFSAKFPQSKNFNKVSNTVFNILNLHRY